MATNTSKVFIDIITQFTGTKSIKQAEIETGVKRKNISKMINGKVNSTGGYIWKRIV